MFPGHLAVYGHDANDGNDGEADAEAALPELAEGEALRRDSVEPRQHFTEPPPRYTEASLVRALEEEGIGRPSTYATIVQTVQKRDYVTKQGRQLVPQELGFLVNDLLEQHMPEYVAVPFTGEMEEELDQVAEGERQYVSVLREFWPEFKEKLDKAEGSASKLQEQTDILCNVCGEANLVLKWGRNGKFFACPRYPECTNSLPMGEDGQPVFVAPADGNELRLPEVRFRDRPKVRAVRGVHRLRAARNGKVRLPLGRARGRAVPGGTGDRATRGEAGSGEGPGRVLRLLELPVLQLHDEQPGAGEDGAATRRRDAPTRQREAAGAKRAGQGGIREAAGERPRAQGELTGWAKAVTAFDGQSSYSSTTKRGDGDGANDAWQGGGGRLPGGERTA